MQKEKRKKVIVDTNIWISHIYSNFKSSLNLILKNESFELVFSEELLEEIDDVVHRPKFSKTISKLIAESFLKLLKQSGEFYSVNKTISVGTDPDDYFLFALAVKSKADYLITGDKQLLELKKYKRLHIISLNEFIKSL